MSREGCVKWPELNKSIPLAATLPTLIVRLTIASGAQTTYSIRRLRPARASFTGTRGGINRRGQVAGSFIRDGSSYAYIRSHGSFRLLGKGVANGSNRLGQVVGVSSVTNHAKLWKHGHALELGTLGGDRAVALVSIATELWSVTTSKTPRATLTRFQWEARM